MFHLRGSYAHELSKLLASTYPFSKHRSASRAFTSAFDPIKEGHQRTELHNHLCDLVRKGLSASPKKLSPELFYDREGSRLFELITELPEYYLTRAEHAILEHHSAEIVRAVRSLNRGKITVIELGAGTATKSQIVSHALVNAQGPTDFVIADVSGAALSKACARIMREEPEIRVIPWVLTHERALAKTREVEEPRLVLFLGSSIGNYESAQAIRLLSEIRKSLGVSGSLILGMDTCQDPEVLLPAYDDARGVTAAFNKNLLLRINEELRGNFVLERFRHVALWNDEASRVEMHLESLVAQEVEIRDCALRVSFRKGERIHTESSHKVGLPEIEVMLGKAGLSLVSTFFDDEHRFALHIARPARS